ncbi:hypothetical protein D7030_08400 [Flavobacteriaceae bacterium AU392]|nr:hypothetical protein D1817_00015 [Flavobacteriaceae bacterium]RKM85139.1 hypothetical protein D7030_08400 [Flavobacteriaceae bacterium AU392]
MKIILKSILCATFLLINSNWLNAQQPKASETLAKVGEYYKSAKTYNLEVEYNMYRGYTGNNKTESYKSTVYKNGGVTQMKVFNSEILQFPEAQITINNQDKTIVYRQGAVNTLQESPIDMSTFLKLYDEVSAKIEGNTIVHELVLKQQINVSIPYNRIKIYIDRDNYTLKKQELFLSIKVPFIDDNGESTDDEGRMEIVFKPNPEAIKRTPKLQDYVKRDSNKKLQLAKAYTNYTLIK